MKLKLRLFPFIATMVGSAVILFGGWFAYHSMAMENPLNHLLVNTPGVQKEEVDLTDSQASFKIELGTQASLRDIYQKIETDGGSIIGKRQIRLDIQSNSTPELEAWWSNALFDVAQAMETKTYAQIPTALQQKAASMPGLKVKTEMDDHNVYVSLTDGEHSKFVVLPRVGGQLGVWPNE